MNTYAKDWPLVDPKDDGIRPAGRPDECFYCRQRVGTPHGRACVMVEKRVEMRVRATLPSGEVLTGSWQFYEPHQWDVSTSEFHKNESSWCASNFMMERELGSVVWDAEDAWDRLASIDTPQRCLCGQLTFEFVRIVDATPRRELRVSQ